MPTVYSTAKRSEKEQKSDFMKNSIKFVHMGRFTSREPWIHPTVKTSSWELIYMSDGEAHLFENDTSFTAKAGDALIFSPNTLHGGTQISEERVSFFWLHFTVENKSEAKRIAALPKILKSAGASRIPTMLRELLHRSNHHIYPMEMNHLSTELLLMEYGVIAALSEAHGKGIGTVHKIREWVRINSDRPLSVRTVAEKFGYNEDYISKLFRRESGATLKSYIDNMRQIRIKSLLSTTDLSLQRISDECGFEDYKAFLKFFTYHEGVTPTKFRTQCYMTHDNNR